MPFYGTQTDHQKTDANIIAVNLKTYYTGLIEVNRESYKVPAGKLKPVLTSFKEIQTAKGDLKTYAGTIELLDYMQVYKTQQHRSLEILPKGQ